MSVFSDLYFLLALLVLIYFKQWDEANYIFIFAQFNFGFKALHLCMMISKKHTHPTYPIMPKPEMANA